jgi:hypothetical protein
VRKRSPYDLPRPGLERRTERAHCQVYRDPGAEPLPREACLCSDPRWSRIVYHPRGEYMPDGSYLCPDCGTRSREPEGIA